MTVKISVTMSMVPKHYVSVVSRVAVHAEHCVLIQKLRKSVSLRGGGGGVLLCFVAIWSKQRIVNIEFSF